MHQSLNNSFQTNYLSMLLILTAKECFSKLNVNLFSEVELNLDRIKPQWAENCKIINEKKIKT